MLVDDVVYFADPTTFNDPLDTNPTFDPDLDVPDLEAMLSSLIGERTEAELASAAKTLRYRGPKTIEHIAKQRNYAAAQLISEIRYSARNPDYVLDNPQQALLGQSIERELLIRYDKGVFSLAKRPNCPLMWSHYGDQHQGVCLGYSVPESMGERIERIRYGGSRCVKASRVQAMMRGELEAQADVDSSILFTKARSWSYEQEWRLLGQRGLRDSPLELEEVVFGMRCPDAVIYIITQALATRDKKVAFYGIRDQPGTFTLKKFKIDVDELASGYPRRCRTFDNLFADTPDDTV